jgi:plasmid stabilization system protein ParE
LSHFFLSSDAEQDLSEIWDYIAKDSYDAADRWIERLFREFERVARSPGIGHTRRDVTAMNVLFWSADSYVVVYRVVARQVQIVGVTEGSRDIPRFLSTRNP